MTAHAPPLPADPLIAEAKQRAMRRRLIGLGLAVVAAVATAVTVSSLRPSHAVTSDGGLRSYRQVNVDSFGRGGGVTWAWSQGGDWFKLWVTANNGRTWRSAGLPNQISVIDIVQVAFADRRHGWFVTDGPNSGYPRHMWGQIFRTTNGGRTWHRSIPPGCHPGCGFSSIAFPTPSNGYLLDGPPKGKGRLWATVDGGVTWRLVSRPSLPLRASFQEDQMTFLTTRVGFVLTGKHGQRAGLARTDDGGRTWKRAALVRGDLTYRIDGSTDMAWMRGTDVVVGTVRNLHGGHERRLVVNASTDSGATWRARTTPWLFASDPGLDVLTPRRWIVSDYDHPRGDGWLSYITTDAGRSWSRLKEPLESAELRLSGTRDAWDLGGVSGYTLMRTTDGGVHWTPAGPRVAKGHKPR